MKTVLKSVLSAKVHFMLFAMTCMLLAAVLFAAKAMTDEISFTNDKSLEQLSHPTGWEPVRAG